MKPTKLFLFVAWAALGAMPATVQAYTFFEDDFEAAPDPGPDADDPLLGNGMVVGANVFNASNIYIGNYFSFPAPNVTGDGARFCNVASEQGGPEQGAKVLSVFSDYNNGAAHTAGDLVDANTFVEFFLEEADLGTTITFQFDVKYGNLDLTPLTGVPEGSAPPFVPEAEAFLKVLDPGDGYSVVLDDLEDATQFPTAWGTYVLTITIPNEPVWVGRLLQAGFRTKTSLYQDSTIYYDNISLTSNRAGTNPNVIRIVSVGKSGDEFAITFEAKVGQLYDLEKYNLSSGEWDLVTFAEAIDPTDTLVDDNATDPTALYRIIETLEE